MGFALPSSSMTAAASGPEDAIYEALKWRLIPVLMLCYVTCPIWTA